MSHQLTTVAVTEFDAQVKQSYQGSGKLRPFVTVRPKVTGSTYKFRKMGKGVATKRVPQTDVIPMNVGYSEQTATLTDWNAPEYTDIFNQAEVNFDEQRELAYVIASAMGRREDQLILDALDAANASANVGVNVGGTNTGLNMAKLRNTKRLMDAAGVPSTDRCFIVSAIGLNDQLLGTTEVTSADYNTVMALVKGEVDTFMGFKFVMIEDRTEGGLPLASNTRTNYAVHRDAIGLAIGLEMRTEVNYIPEKTSWLANELFKAGAVARDAAGVIETASYE